MLWHTVIRLVGGVLIANLLYERKTMSNTEHREKHSTRLHKEISVIKKQAKIAMQHGVPRNLIEDQPHRFAKHRAMDCGNPNCPVCSNPRKLTGELTIQEKRMYQDVDSE